ncbi:MAG TPA: hypothetical protein VMH78_02730 [Thermoplasmata archaeon]|nr:hypothetical protein [Thermoplasmata archaeon]
MNARPAEPTAGPGGPPARRPFGGLPAAAWRAVVLGLLIREGFSFWTGHPYDFEVWIRTGHAVAAGTNPYAFWPSIPGVSISYIGVPLPSAAYLPFWPLVTGGLYRLWEAVGGGNRFVLYFLLKQPPILGDTATALLLYRAVVAWRGDAATALRAVRGWSFFPYAILIGAVWGQFDSLVVASIVAGLLARRSWGRVASHGWGIFVKWVTAIFLPLEAFAARGLRRAEFLLGLAIPAVATVAVFVVFGWGFTNVVAASTSQSRGGGGGMNWVGVLTSPPINPFLAAHPAVGFALSYLWVPAVLLAGWLGARWMATGRPEAVLRAMILVTLAFLLFRWGLYEQYMLYLFVLLWLDILLFHPDRGSLWRWTNAVAWAYLLINNDLAIRFLSPLSPSVTAFTDTLDASPAYGTVRVYAGIAVAILMTVLLARLVLVYLRDERSADPWWRFGRPRPPTTLATAPG